MISATRRPWYSIASFVVFLAVSAGISAHCYRSSVLGIDVLGYAGIVALNDTGNVVKVHDILYSHPLNAHLRGLDGDTVQARDMRRRAADPYLAAMHFPYFAIKPLYISTLQVVHRFGLSAIDSVRAVSALSLFGIAIMFWIYTRSLLALIPLILPETLLLGQTHDPDGMSCLLLLLGLWLVFVKRVDMGLLPLLVAIWVRPENALLTALVVVAMFVQGRVDWIKAAILVVLSFASVWAINHYGYPWEEMYGHFLGAAPGTGDASTFVNYWSSLAKSVTNALRSAVPLFVILWMVCFPFVEESMQWILGVTLVFSAARFLMFPGYEPRYYGLFFTVTAIGAVVAIRDGAYRELARKWKGSLRTMISRWIYDSSVR